MLYDADGSGSISMDEFKEMLSGSAQNLDDDLWITLVREIDVDGDGEISFEEFEMMMKKFSQDDESIKALSLRFDSLADSK